MIRPSPTPRRGRAARGIAALAAVGVLVASIAGCGIVGSPSPTALAIPEPSCGGARVEIPGALPCDRLVEVAIGVLRDEVPALLDRGVVAVTVDLQGCPRNEVPPQLDCTGEDFVQLVTVTFGPTIPGGPMEPSLGVGLAPVSGRLLGIVNPLIR
ncbi:MAG TPA: hypothetical protein VFX65_08060 [Candidatus Limnocylindrales bacterium]|nr:hypothetical protein [Candidatus Limnocylindrales bacterium]